MKDQYFGDVNDYRKYGLLRALQAPASLSLCVAWMLTSDDGSSDGALRGYLSQPDIWRHHDPELFDKLCSALANDRAPSVTMTESRSVLRDARYFSTLVPDNCAGRLAWGGQLVRASEGADLTFLDPDNGLQIASLPV